MAKDKIDKKTADLFAGEVETEDKVRCSIYIKASVHAKVVAASEKAGRSINQVVERILEKYFDS